MRKACMALCAAIISLAMVNGQTTVPSILPKPDTKAPGKGKPVKIYILAGQSNMVGFGRLSNTKSFYPSVFLSADPGVRPCIVPAGSSALLPFSVYQDATGNALGAKVEQPKSDAIVNLGSVTDVLPTVKGADSLVVKAFIEVPTSGTHQLHAGYGPSSHAIVTLNGKEVYRKEIGKKATITDVELEAGKRYPISVTFLKGGSAAFWIEHVNLTPKGGLTSCIKEGKFPWFTSQNGEWSVRNDVTYLNVRTSKKENDTGAPLTTTSNGGMIGPEVPFGYVMGTYHDEPVLLIESSMGNRALSFDFRPPSSPKTDEEKANKYCGYEYNAMVKGVHETLKNIDKVVPGYAGQGYEIAGFVWFQGHKDKGKTKEEYEAHLVNLIQDLRKEFKAPTMKAVVATVAFGGYRLNEGWHGVHAAQMAVSDPKQHPEFAGQVATVDARGFWRSRAESPSGTDYHYNHNAETYTLIGDALGREMVKLMGGKAEPGPIPPRKPEVSTPVAEMSLTDMGKWIYTDDFLIRQKKDLETATPEQIKALQTALRPVILDKMLPDFLAGAIGGRDKTLETLVKGEPVKGYKPGIPNEYDRVIGYYNSAGITDYDWKRIVPGMQKATWNYYSFDPPEKQAPEKHDRLRKITMPQGMENWFAKDFDSKNAGWKTGPSPFGTKGGKKMPFKPYCKDPDCGCGEMPGTHWEKEVLLMQQTFKVPPVKEGHRYRLIVGGTKHNRTGEGLQIFINGKKFVETKGGYFKGSGGSRGGYFLNDFLPELKTGEITIAVKTFLRYTYFRGKTTYFDKKDDPVYYAKPVPPHGNISMWLEETKLPESVLELKNAMPPPKPSKKKGK